MRKTIISLIAVFTIGFVLGFFAHPVLARNYDVQVEVNDQLVTFDEKPYIEKMTGRTYVPIRFIAEKLGANVDWDQETKTVTIFNGSDSICLQIGSQVPTINNIAMAQQLDAPARLDNKRTYVPLRFVSEVLGQNVLWDKYNRLVRISDKPFVVTEKLSEEQKKRLMSYPYPVVLAEDNYGSQEVGETYKIKRKMVEDKEYGNSLGFTDEEVLAKMQEPIELLNVIESNQEFVTDVDLIYYVQHPIGPARIRGILQTYEPDGTITEQDIEFGFGYGQRFVSEGEPRDPRHWFEEYDTKPFSKPKVVGKK